MTGEIILLVIACAAAYGVFAYRRSTQRLSALYREEARAYNEAAFNEVVEESPDER